MIFLQIMLGKQFALMLYFKNLFKELVNIQEIIRKMSVA
jgi:hypothetical protein